MDVDTIPNFLNILDGQNVDGYIWDVYDGDTFKAVVQLLGIQQVKITCRLNGLDTPELRTKDDNEKRFAIIARDALRAKILGKNIQMKIEGADKYGRMLVSLPEILDYMLDNNYGYSYDGGKKEEITYGEGNTFTRRDVEYVMSDP